MIIAAGIIYFLHKGLVDVKMWTRMPDQQWIRDKYWFLIGDGVYLGGTVVVYLLSVFTAWFAGKDISNLPLMIKQVFVGMLLGSELWDLVFGYVVDQDPLYAFADWYGGVGFSSKAQRIVFDVIRIMLAVIIWIIF